MLSGPRVVTVAFLGRADESVTVGFFLSLRGYLCAAVFCAEVLKIILSVQSTDKIPILPSPVEELKTDPGILIQLKSSAIRTHYTVVSFFFKFVFSTGMISSMLVLQSPLSLRKLVIKVCRGVM